MADRIIVGCSAALDAFARLLWAQSVQTHKAHIGIRVDGAKVRRNATRLRKVVSDRQIVFMAAGVVVVARPRDIWRRSTDVAEYIDVAAAIHVAQGIRKARAAI